MKLYLVFDTEAEALAAAAAIFQIGGAMYSDQAFHTDGKLYHLTANGDLDFTGPATESWDTPQQRADGRWIVCHPSQNLDASTEQVAQALIIAGLSEADAEPFDPAWFTPQPQGD